MKLLKKRAQTHKENCHKQRAQVVGKDGCNASQKFLEVSDIQLTVSGFRGRVACDEEDIGESYQVVELFFLKYVRI